MSDKSWHERVRDILDAIAEIEDFTRGMSLDALRQDEKTLKAVALDFIITGEAANRVPQNVQEAHPEIPWPLMRALRNRIVHDHFSVDPKIVLDTVRSDLPPLVGTPTETIGNARRILSFTHRLLPPQTGQRAQGRGPHGANF